MLMALTRNSVEVEVEVHFFWNVEMMYGHEFAFNLIPNQLISH